MVYEMFADSSEWVMVPNVYGMGLFSDGGIFATKPYLWFKLLFENDGLQKERGETVDGLYWRFINKNRKFFSSNPRLNMMVNVFDKMKQDRKKEYYRRQNFLSESIQAKQIIYSIALSIFISIGLPS